MIFKTNWENLKILLLKQVNIFDNNVMNLNIISTYHYDIYLFLRETGYLQIPKNSSLMITMLLW